MQTKYGPQNHSCESFDRNKWAVNIQGINIFSSLMSNLKNPSLQRIIFFALWESWKIKNHLWNMSIFSLFSSINRPFLTSSFQVFLFLLKKALWTIVSRFFCKTTFHWNGKGWKLFISTTFWNVYVIQTLNFIQSVNSFRSLN